MSIQSFTVDLADTTEFQRLLDKNTQTNGMKAGRVYLAPNSSCGRHSTHENEEMLIFLSGTGIANIDGADPMTVGQGKVAYIPPETLHDIENNTDQPLIYIYCVAPAKNP